MRSEWFRDWRIWKYCIDYFPIKLVKTCDLDSNKNYLVLAYPHGLLMMSPWFLASSNASGFKNEYPGMTSYLATVQTRFSIPFERELVVYGGCCIATEECLLYLLDEKKHKGNFVMINTGGSAEAILTRKDQYNLYLKNRKGFARIALKSGASIVPMFSFGENKLFDGVAFKPNTLLGKFQNWVRDVTKFALIPPLGRGFFQYSFGMIPHRVPVHIVVGAPLEVGRVPEPTQAQVDELHARLVSSLRALYDQHKHQYEPDPDTPLNII
ncbi:hypothetical protein evm_004905 [Chilo suppressalis]|nr:hypothetical protein evm_004905 [Chilo suppressalis]